MHPYLIRLGVRPEVMEFFAPFISINCADLVFQQGNYLEHYGFAFHRVDSGGDLWIAGAPNLANQLLIACSIMDIIAYLHYYGHHLPNWDTALFIATGSRPTSGQLQHVSSLATEKSMILVFPADLLGAITDLKVAAAFRRMPAAAFLAEKERLHICFRSKVFEFDRQGFSLSVFERAAKYRFTVTTRKPKHGASFLEQLQAGAFPSL